VIPVRLDNGCEIPDEFRTVQWLSCPPDACEICAKSLLESLQTRAATLGRHPITDVGHDALLDGISEIRRALLSVPSRWEIKELLHRCEWLARQHPNHRSFAELQVLRDQIERVMLRMEAPAPRMSAPPMYAPSSLPLQARFKWLWSAILASSLITTLLFYLLGRPALFLSGAVVSLAILLASGVLRPVPRIFVVSAFAACVFLAYGHLIHPLIVSRVQASDSGLTIITSNIGAARARNVVATVRARSNVRRDVFAARDVIQEISPGETVSRYVTFGGWASDVQLRPITAPSAISSTVVLECINCEPSILSAFHVTAPY
jgi:hypothetical protein